MDMGERLRLLRIAKNLSQQDVANMLGISRPAYNKYENGSSKPIRRLPELAKILGVDVDYILGTNQPSEVILLSKGEKECLDKFKLLNDENKYKILGMLDLLIAQQQNAADQAEDKIG